MRPLGQTFHAAPHIIVVKIFAGRRFERKNLTALRINAGHHMLDRAVFSRRVHRLEDEQDGPTILGIKHVLKFGEYFDAHGQCFLGARLVFGGKLQRVTRVEVLQAKIVIRHAEGLGKFARRFNQSFHLFVVHEVTFSFYF